MNQIAMILLISLLVLVHEAGHFIAARIFGVRVTRFGIGMPIGPSKKMFRWNNTDFYIHAFLFGGYVAFPDDNMEAEDIQDNEVLPPDSPELYENKTIGQKLAIVSAGVIMNVVFAVILVLFCAMYYHKLPSNTQSIMIEGFLPKVTSNIIEKDIKKGDKLLKVNDYKINNLYELSFFTRNSKTFDDYAQEDIYKNNLEKLKKINKIKDENAILKENSTIKLVNATAENKLQVNKNILKGLEKYKKDGIKLDEKQIELRDEIYNQKTYKVNKQVSLNDIALSLSDSYKPMDLVVLRDNKEVHIDNLKINKEGMLGITLKVNDIYSETKTPKDIVVKSFDYIYTTTATMLFSLWQLVTGKVSASDMHGVIAVVKVGGDIIASKGFLNGILLTAMISINLAIMNILPIPALDGGHVMFLIIEKLTGKKPSKETSEKITNFFFFLLIVLMVCICYNDIFALVTKKF